MRTAGDWDDGQWAAAVESLQSGGSVDAWGVQISPERLESLLYAAPRGPKDRPKLAKVAFDGATFGDGVSFAGAIFADRVSFSGAAFGSDISFAKTTFAGHACFDWATFGSGASFARSNFERGSSFHGAVFGGGASFDEAVFAQESAFPFATFDEGVSFGRAAFKGAAIFHHATLNYEPWFGDAIFDSHAIFWGATFTEVSRLVVNVRGTVDLSETTFHETIDLKLRAQRLLLARATFAGAVNLSVNRAEIALDQANFNAPSTLDGSPDPLLSDVASSSAEPEPPPRLVSLRRANAGNLTVSDVDLRACRFAGARNFDQFRFGSQFSFAHIQPGRGRAKRQVIADEADWRARRPRGRGYVKFPEECAISSDWSGERKPAEPGEIGSIYRALRKWREDNKDEPGAADFYYGEMEMRRHDGSVPLAERTIIWLYWLVSGYGLRGSRALLCLLGTILVFAALLHGWGFQTHQHFTRALTFSAESTTSLFRTPPKPGLSLTGEWLQIGLRLLGPLFFGLTLLSLRGRVKR